MKTKFNRISEWIVSHVDNKERIFIADNYSEDGNLKSCEFSFDSVIKDQEEYIKVGSLFYEATSNKDDLCIVFNSIPLWREFDFNKIPNDIKEMHRKIFGEG